MTKKQILVTYASKSGFTVPMAEAIGEAASGPNISVEVMPVKKVKSLEGYDAAIIGSSIRMGNWLPEAKQFVSDHHDELQKLPTAIFTVHMLNADDSAESVAARATYIAPILEMISPSDAAFFTGGMKLSELSFFERTLSKMLKAVDEDLRDYEALKAWAEKTANRLTTDS